MSVEYMMGLARQRAERERDAARAWARRWKLAALEYRGDAWRAARYMRVAGIAKQKNGRLLSQAMAYARLARAVRAQAAAQAAATGSDSASWVDFVSADVLRLLEEVGDGAE